MSKFFTLAGALCFIVFLWIAQSFEWGLAQALFIFLSVLSGVGSVAFMQLPDELTEDQFKLIQSGHIHDLPRVIQEWVELASEVRKNGLLGAEGVRKSLQDQNLIYLTKRMVDGYDKKQILPWIHNQREYEGFWLQQVHQFQERISQLIPTVGILATLILLMMGLKIAPLLFPLVVSVVLQFIFHSITLHKIHTAKLQSVAYFRILEEGLLGVAEGMNADFLNDQLVARLGLIQKKVGS